MCAAFRFTDPTVGKCVRCLPFIFCFAFIILLLLLDPCERKVCPMSWLSLSLLSLNRVMVDG